MTSKKTIKSALESMLFVWGDPLDAKVAADLFNISVKEAYDYFKELQAEYDEQDSPSIILVEGNTSNACLPMDASLSTFKYLAHWSFM
jgi:segregation and condensation protein B